MSAPLTLAAIILVIVPALGALVVWMVSALDDHDAPMLVCVGVPYLTVCALAAVISYGLAAL